MYWYWDSPVGTFTIQPASEGAIDLWLDDAWLGSYDSPHDAAARVHVHATGASLWDAHTGEAPEDLAAWNPA
jgi:hypothetical protein